MNERTPACAKQPARTRSKHAGRGGARRCSGSEASQDVQPTRVGRDRAHTHALHVTRDGLPTDGAAGAAAQVGDEVGEEGEVLVVQEERRLVCGGVNRAV